MADEPDPAAGEPDAPAPDGTPNGGGVPTPPAPDDVAQGVDAPGPDAPHEAPHRAGMPGPARSGWRAAITLRRAITAAVIVALLAALVVWLRWPDGEPVRTSSAMLTVRSGPERNQPIKLDTSFFVPKSASKDHPAPAVLLAHGFGGSKTSVAAQAKRLAGEGYAVLTWSARGFGKSDGTIALDDPDYEVNDARGLIDWLGTHDEVQQDGAKDPRVAVVGASYGGALALLVAGYDTRVDAIVPQITWNDLARAFFPEGTGASPEQGVFKKSWAGLFFGSASSGGATSPADLARLLGLGDVSDPSQVDPSKINLKRLDELVRCGRFSPDVCALYLRVATSGRADADAVARLRRSSPAGVLDRIKAPTLLIQGQADTLFGLDQADATARGIAANGTTVRVAWYAGGHDTTASDEENDRIEALTTGWLDHYLRNSGPAPADGFSFTTQGAISLDDARQASRTYIADRYPGLKGDLTPYKKQLTGVAGDLPQPVANPPSGNPAAISSLPGIGALARLGGVTLDVPGQSAAFTSQPFDAPVDVVGSPTVRIRASSPTGSAVLFVKLYDVDATGRATLPGGGVAPVRLTGLPKTPALPGTAAADQTVVVTMPAIGHRFEAGHRVRVVIATSDQAYSGPAEPVVYQVGAVLGSLTLPQADVRPAADSAKTWTWVLVGAVLAVFVGVVAITVVARVRRRRRDRDAVVADAAELPLAVRSLRKAYGDGYLAVKDVSFTVEPDQVVGLLGPNGAGKTTALRMLMGLIRPTAGEILVFGVPIRPGAPVLSRIGAFVEGPGFLPHLSGLANLRRYWQATGRPIGAARIDEALEIAGLGEAIHRKVKTYSQGMRQRLAIAQAMLGLPDLLVLDEPTNGLDPPQIAEMREVLARYATDGRAVLISSHLLAEVEQVCTHVVVMSKGSRVAAGTVADVVGAGRSLQVDVVNGDRDTAVATLNRMRGVTTATANGHGPGSLVVELDGAERSDVVRELVGAGVGVERIAPRRRLEDVFLELVEDHPEDAR
jgi:ABC-2 type transport system ATP-binding protein